MSIRALLRERLAAANLATIIVTHDVVDALVMADRVAILDDGRIVDSGEAAIVLGQPVNRFAATLAGLNFLNGELCRAFPPSAVRLEATSAPPATTAAATGTAATASAAPLTAAAGELTWNATVARLEPAVQGVRVTLEGDTIVADLSAAQLLASGIREGTAVTVSVNPAFVTAYPARTMTASSGKM